MLYYPIKNTTLASRVTFHDLESDKAENHVPPCPQPPN